MSSRERIEEYQAQIQELRSCKEDEISHLQQQLSNMQSALEKQSACSSGSRSKMFPDKAHGLFSLNIDQRVNIIDLMQSRFFIGIMYPVRLLFVLIKASTSFLSLCSGIPPQTFIICVPSGPESNTSADLVSPADECKVLQEQVKALEVQQQCNYSLKHMS